MVELRYIDAIRGALESEMARDERVTILGEDVTVGGPFGATKDLLDRFGPRRIRDTPISEGTVVGMAIGAALAGQRPVVEVMFIDFITLAMDQFVNHAAKLRYMSGGLLDVPLVIRAQGGAAGSMGAHHSQSLEAWFTHMPGLQVVAPSTPADARSLLTAAIGADDPVLFLEHRALYWQREDLDEDDDESATFGGPAIRRAGADVTIVSWSHMVHTALAAADVLAGDGVEAEVIDLRVLRPLDLSTVIASVTRTGHCVVAHEAVLEGGFGAEVASRIHTAAFDDLDAPVERVGAPFVPPPFSPALESAFVPSADDIVTAARRSLGSATVSA